MRHLFVLIALFWVAGMTATTPSRVPGDTVAVKDRPTIAALFKTMPDSLMPYLTENNRLDMIDFMEAGMKAEVTNRLECKSEMLMLTADSLSIRLSESKKTDLFIIPVEEVYDSCRLMICMRQSFFISEREVEVVNSFYSAAWRPLPLAPVTHHVPMESVFSLDKVVNLRGRKNL